MEKKLSILALITLYSKGARTIKRSHIFISTALILLLPLMASCSSMDEMTLPARSSYSLMDTLKLNVPYVASKVFHGGGVFYSPWLDKDRKLLLT